MESAFAWIGQVVEWIGRFIPRREILDSTEGAIKYSGFVLPRKLRVRYRGFDGEFRVTVHGPGIHWWWPWTSRWAVQPVVRQTDQMETQTMETVDGKTFIAGGTITYEVTDLFALAARTHSPFHAVRDMAATALHDVCCDFEWAALQAEQRRGTIKTKLKNEAQKQLKDYGVTVIKMQLTTLARAKVLKISQSTASEES